MTYEVFGQMECVYTYGSDSALGVLCDSLTRANN